MDTVIETQGLRKEWRRRGGTRTVAVAGLDLAVPRGGVFGFLGPNGSGKTTTIRCLLGLVAPSAGQTALLGQRGRSGLSAAMPRVGAIVEAPALFPTMTARQNLTLLGAIDRIGPRRVNEVLELTGLSDRADDDVRKYSLGMRQRLGLAAALMKDPELLVLDEPVNGLDPAGIREVRELLARLGGEGRTVFLSSHILSEIEQVCDEVAIIDRGRLVLQGRIDEVLATASRQKAIVRVEQPELSATVLRDAGFTVENAEGVLHVDARPNDASHITKALAGAGLYLSELRQETVSLEDLFLSITNHEPEGALL